MRDRDVERSAMLRELGFGHPDAESAAIRILVRAKLTTPRKTRIATAKTGACREALQEELIVLCPRCLQSRRGGESGRGAVPAARPTDCECCGGSANRAAVDRATRACRATGMSRVLVVGGSPGVHTALRGLWPRDIGLRIVAGTARHSGAQARANLRWADLVVVWGGTELSHKVSLLYTKARPPRAGKVIVASRRSIEALANRIHAHLGSRASAAGLSRGQSRPPGRRSG